jgi:hypothetical protein
MYFRVGVQFGNVTVVVRFFRELTRLNIAVIR